nr:hypothetical protein [uncultured Celeribacter sp.]
MAILSDEIVLHKALFDAATGQIGPTAWSGFLAPLRELTRADHAALLWLPEALPMEHWGAGPAAGPDWLPEEESLRLMRPDRVYAQIDLPVARAGGPILRAVRCRVEPDPGATTPGSVVLAIWRKGRDFRAADGVVLTNLVPFLGQAVEIWRRLCRERAAAGQSAELAARLGAGALALSVSGELMALSDMVHRTLVAPGALQVLGNGRLRFVDPGADQVYRTALSSLQTDPEATAEVTVAQGQLRLTRGKWCRQPAILGGLRVEMRAEALPVARVAAHFGLSRSEARLARLLCDGRSLKEAAVELGWTLETTRSCSKRIFARVGVNGQPALVRHMLNSAVWV